MSELNKIKSTLQDLGYPIIEQNGYWKTRGLYRDGSDTDSLTIYYRDNLVIDHVTAQKFSIEHLIALTLNLKDDAKAGEWLKDKNISLPSFNTRAAQQIKVQEIFDDKVIHDLVPNYDYFVNRGISQKTCEVFKGGLCINGLFKDRQCLVIYNSKGQIVGITGRDIKNRKKLKWMHKGQKNNFVYPAYLNQQFITDKSEVILVESPIDVLKMWDNGINNVICIFGVEISNAVINFLLKKHPKKIIVALNNEESKIGNNASNKVKARLDKYFDKSISIIKLPYKKDFGEMSNEEIRKWNES